MARQSNTKIYKNFLKGINTDTSEYLFPEESTVDEQNFEIGIDGVRKRRLGLKQETSMFTTIPDDSPYVDYDVNESSIVSHVWYNTVYDLKILIVIGRERISFFDMETNTLLSKYVYLSGECNVFLGYDHKIPPKIFSNEDRAFIFHPHIQPIMVEATSSSASIRLTQLVPSIRDFQGNMNDTDLTAKITDPYTGFNDASNHGYNLYNQGWSVGNLNTFFNALNYQPTNADIWTYGVRTNSDGSTSFDPNAVVQLDLKTSRAPMGSAIVPIYSRANGVDKYPTRTTTPSRVAASINAIGVNYIDLDLTLPQALSVFDPDYFGGQIWLHKLEIVYQNSETIAWAGMVNIISSSAGSNIVTVRVSDLNVFVAYKSGTPSDYAVVGGTVYFSPRGNGNYISDPKKYPRLIYRYLPSAGAVYAGRLWYGNAKDGKSIYFSQILESDYSNAHACYQQADPTAKDINALVDSDGGEIRLAEVGTILDMQVFNDHLMLFAENGIWYITSKSHAADSFKVTKLSSHKILSNRSVVDTDDGMIYLARSGMYRLTANIYTGLPEAENMSRGRVQNELDKIPESTAHNVQGIFNPQTQVVQYWYTHKDQAIVVKLDRCLNYNKDLDAFYPYQVTEQARLTRMASVFYNISEDPKLQTLCLARVGLDTIEMYSFSNESWEDINVDADAYLITGHEVGTDPMNQIQPVYAFTYMSKTETTWVDNGSGGVVPDKPSSCILQARWSWADSSAGGKWSPAREVYRQRNYISEGATLPHDTGDALVVSKNKIRGRGRAVNFKMSSQPGYDCQIQGLAVEYSISTVR